MERIPDLPLRVPPLVQPQPPQPIAETRPTEAPEKAPGRKDRADAPPRTGSGRPAPTPKRPSQRELADQARDKPAPRPPLEPGVDQETIDKIRDEAEASVPVVEGVNGTPEDSQG
jgi:hypothetical protein